MKKLCVLFLISLLLLASCASVSDVGKVPQASDTTDAAEHSSGTSEVSRGESLLARGDLMQAISVQKADGKQADDAFRRSQMRLAMELFASCAVKSEGENVLISPLSVQSALAMTANGASGQTLEEMERLLGGELSIGELNEYLCGYIGSLPTDGKYKVSLANSIWFRECAGFEVFEDFLQTNAKYYGAQAYAAPFDGTTVKQINEWVDVHTDGMIKDVIDEIDPAAMVFLINALAFDAEWSVPYDKYSVRDGRFTDINGDACDAEFMSAEEYYYLETENAVGFAKNYNGGKYRFVALLPDEGVDLYDYIASLDGETVLNALDGMQSASVYATMPKFSYEYSLGLNDVLSALGMPTAFTSAADLSKTSNAELFISSVFHKTFIEVAEKGTRAGAVTVVQESLECEIEYKAVITLDRPFVYMIVDSAANLPLFIGAVTEI